MNIYITLDYELFFGPKSGTVDKCIIEPTEKLLKIVDPFNIKFVCFVDSGYLLALEKQMGEYPILKKDYDKIVGQIQKLSAQGHGIELHIHPHWEDSSFDGSKWKFDTTRYRLHDFTENEVHHIVTRYTKILEKITGTPPKAYRAGGWSAQPFHHIKEALKKNRVLIDSTVYPKGYYLSENQRFDFSSVPEFKTFYRFSNNLTEEDNNGEFVEIPISSYRVAPFFFWRFVLIKLLKQRKHLAFGDGSAIPMAKKNVLKLLLSFSNSVVSMDGFKAFLIKKAFKAYKNNTTDNDNFVIIGHPKAFSSYSLKQTEKFLKETYKQHNYKTF